MSQGTSNQKKINPPPGVAERLPRLEIGDGATMRFCPQLAAAIGTEQSILLLQLDYWLASDPAAVTEDGQRWLGLSVRDIWNRMAKCWSLDKINRLLNQLAAAALLIMRAGKHRCDARQMALNYETIACLKVVQVVYEDKTPAEKGDDPGRNLGQGVRLSDTSITPGNGQGVRNQDTIRIYDGDDQNNLTTLLDHQHRERAREAALQKAGVQPASWKYFEQWSAEEVELLCEQSRGPGIDKPQGFMVSQAKHPEGLAMIRQAMETQHQFEAMLRQKQEAERPSVEELAALEVERAALRTIAQREYEAEKAAYDALLSQMEKIAPKSFWSDRWLLTLNSMPAQLHRATINSWITDSEAIGLLTEGVQQFLVVQVKSHYSKDWLDQRLCGLIRGMLATLAGQPDIQIKYVVEPQVPRANTFKPEWMAELEAESKTALVESAA